MTADERMPTFPTVRQWMDYFTVLGQPTYEELEVACRRVSPNPAVTLLASLHAAGLLTEDAARYVGVVWSGAELPQEVMLDRGRWLELFAIAGYTVDGQRSERPKAPLQLYRGAPYEHRHGMAWTDSAETAQQFADGKGYARSKGQVWTATVEPSRLLCHCTERRESEYVINPAGLRVDEPDRAG